MDLNSNISLFTTVLGWQFYAVFWAILSQTGLVLFPLFGMVFGQLMSARGSGSMFSVNTDGALSGLEVKIMTMFLILMIGAIPTSGTSIRSDTFTYSGSVIGDTDTAYDDTFGVSPLVADVDVPVPAWWFLVMNLSNGMTNAVSGVMESEFDTAYRQIETAMQTLKIRNPSTKVKLNIFNSECYLPARSKFFDQALTADEDINYQGANFFFDTPGFYDTMRSKRLVPGFDFDPLNSPEYSEDPGLGGKPLCSEFWDILQDDLLVEAARGPMLINPVISLFFDSEEERNDKIVKAYILKEGVELYDRTDDIANDDSGIGSYFSSILSRVTDAGSAALLIPTVAFLRFTTSFIIQALPIVQAYILMVLYMTIPLGLIISGYSFKFLIDGAVLIFTVTFWTALWTIAGHSDALLRDTFWTDPVASIVQVVADPSQSLKAGIHQLVVLILYLVLPALGTKMIMAGAGAMTQALSGVSQSVSSISAQSGGNAVSGGKLIGGQALRRNANRRR